MQVILLEKVKNLGNLGETVNVKPGYGRFLNNQKKAVFATEKNLQLFAERRAELEQNAHKLLEQAKQRAARINDLVIVLAVNASDEGKLYGSIGINEIADALLEKGIDISKREIVLAEGPFHSVGNYEVALHIHTDVIAKLQIQVVSAK